MKDHFRRVVVNKSVGEQIWIKSSLAVPIFKMNVLWSNLQKMRVLRRAFRLIMVLFGLLGFSFYVYENLRPHQVYLRDTNTRAFLPCHRSPKHLRELVKLVEDASMIMDSLNITNFLLYGSLWGVCRFRGPLPWDHDADFGIIGDERYHAVKKCDFVKAFEAKGIRVNDDWFTMSYGLKRGPTASLGVFVYVNDGGKMKRPAPESWIGFVHYNLYHTFPAWMARTPLPTKRFGWFNARVPRGGCEILKHLYPFHWQLEFLPTACKRKGVTMEYLTKFVRENVTRAWQELQMNLEVKTPGRKG